MHSRPAKILSPGRTLALALLAGSAAVAAPRPAPLPPADETTVRFDHPAPAYVEACPVGNGRLGAMMFGGTRRERIVLNETGVWSGSPHEFDRPDGAKYLPELRRLLFSGHEAEAEDFAQAHFTSVPLVPREPVHVLGGHAPGIGSETWFGCYQTLGNLWLDFDLPETVAQGYRRELDLEHAVARTEFTLDGVRYTREVLASHPDDVIAMRLAADHPGRLSFTARLDRPEKFTTTAQGADGLLMTGQLENGTDGKGVRYAARLQVHATGGTVVAQGNAIRVTGADEVVLLVDGLTDIRTFAGRRADDPAAGTAADLARVGDKSFAALRSAHVADFQGYFDRSVVRFGPASPKAATASTWDRMVAFEKGTPDPGLIALYYNFGRYLLISSSRQGGLPPNLQGLWADEIQTPWNGDWHIDVNVEVNYWPADVTGLGDLESPLFDLVSSLQQPGALTARRYFGARGWVAYMFTDPWGFTSPGNLTGWGQFQVGSAWLCQELYDHYVFTKDRAYLERAYPILKGAARFYCDSLAEEPTTHYLVTAPTNSPENPFYTPDGRKGMDTYGSTMDMQILRKLFDSCIAASETLGVDPDFRAEVKAKRARLVPNRIGPDGRLMEWFKPYREVDIHHRHVSHLWGLYPGTEITPDGTPELAAAARKSLEVRGDDGTGWVLAIKTALWARLWDGERALGTLRLLLRPCTAAQVLRRDHSGSYANLFDSCPPFQIDGNLGAPAAIAEMLVQSRNDEIRLLPALPWELGEGSATGIRTRGGFVVDLAWKDSRLTRAVIHATADRHCVVRCAGREAALDLAPGAAAALDGELKFQSH